ncbi:acyl-CoA dehydrogenase family protein [Rhodococcus wratislaviensis]|uniref:acyl-CoA dehydrogenase family protein n=1 Tax=Rhodococcus wratislaviensis TaxID=44752 RepID=UPI001CECDBC8|nr:acyl-CoA dehydrogenase family protein [Rhodococcus wratislaviensis]
MFQLDKSQQDFQEATRSWVEKHFPKSLANELERREHEYPFQLWDALADAGFHGVGIAEEHGGQGGDTIDACILARELARNLGGLTWTWAISSFAGARAIAHGGTEDQKQQYLPQLAKGKCRFSIAVTEPGGGTDLIGGMHTRATPTSGGYKLTGQKMWSTGAKQADYLLLLALDGERDTKGRPRTTLFLLPTSSPGIEMRYIPKLGMRAIGSCEIFLDDVFVPTEQVLGEVGSGFRVLTAALNNERILSGAMALGMLDGVLDEVLEHARNRKAFGRPIGSFQIIQHYIADMLMWQKQSELMVLDAAWREAADMPCHAEANMAKVVTSEYAVKAADQGIQILGGVGIAAETNSQRFWRDVRQFRIAPISNEMARNVMAESVGLPRSF